MIRLGNNFEESFRYISPAALTVETFLTALFLGVFKATQLLESHFSKNSGI